MSPHRRTGLVVTALLIAAPAVASDRLAAFDEARWTQRDGLPQSTVTGIAPAPDGTLWLTTFGGLARFDGHRAVAVTPPADTLARVSRLATLAVDARDPALLWLGTVDSGLWTFDGTTFDQPHQPARLQHAVVYAIAQRDDTLIAASNLGAFARDVDGLWTALSEEASFDAAIDPDDGTQWLCLTEGRYQRRTAAGVDVLTLPQDGPDPETCLGGTLDPDGAWWVQSNHALWLVEGTAPARKLADLHIDARWGQRPVVDARGHLWIADARGAADLGPWQQVKAAARAGAPVTPRVHDVGAPRAWHAGTSGTVWIGTLGNGLVRLSPLGFARIGDAPPPGSRGTGPLHGTGDALWFTVDCFDLKYRSADGRHVEVPLEDTTPGDPACVDALWSDGDRALVARGADLLEGTPAGLRIVSRQADVEIDGTMSFLEGRRAGGAWVGTQHGRLFTWADGALSPHTPPLPPGTGVVLDVLELASGPLVVGHSRGICLDEGAGWRCLDEADGIVPGAIRHLAEDADGRLWLASYGGGLGWLDARGAGRIHSGPAGVPDRFLSTVVFDAHGSVWLQGNAGLTRARVADLQAVRAAPDKPLRTELVPVGEANGWLRQSAAMLGDQLWLAGVEAITVLDTAAFDRPTVAPPPELRSAAIGDLSLPLDARTEVPADAFRRLEVTWAAPALDRSGEAWFEHRLLRPGRDTEWVQAADARTAVYAGLTPGAYRFEVRGVGLDGRRSPAANLAFAIAPYWWERPWIVPLVGLLLIGVAAFVQGLRTRAVRRRNRELQDEIALRKQIEQELQDREARFRQVFDQAVNGFLLHDATDGHCILANPRACRLFGLTRAQMLATPRRALGLPVLDEEQTAGPEPVICTRQDGTRFPARVDQVRYQGREGPRVLTSIVDLTALVASQNQQQHLRRQLASAQRLEALGRLAGGVAHDMNNVLAAVATNVELLGEMADPRELDAPSCLADARDSVERGSAMVRQLLAFSRRREVEVTDVDPAALVEQLARMLRQLLPEDRQFDVQVAPTGCVRINRTQLEQVVLNLVINASDAVGSGGRVALKVSNGPGGESARIVVEDNGPGIEDHVLEHIFEPFFTTKDPGEGTGLGLPTAKGVVEEAGGTLTVDTSPGGTRFQVTLPVARAAPPDAAASAEAAPRGDGRLIVLVDDDPGVRRSVKRHLVRAGWAVEDFEDPLVARDRLLGDGPVPVLLVTDVVMPALNGRQLAQAARRCRPDLRVLFISGYTADVLGAQAEDGDALLHKPFSRDTLLRAVHDHAAPRP